MDLTVISRTFYRFCDQFKRQPGNGNLSRQQSLVFDHVTISKGSTQVFIISKKRSESPLFKAIRENDIQEVIELIQTKMVDPHERGTVGETAVHAAAMYNNKEALILLLNAYPFLINASIDCEEYKGETALHIATVNQNPLIVKELLARKADIDNARAVGSFFAPETGHCYYGEYVLSFAACIGNKEIVEILVRAGALLHAKDSQGNTVFHMLVLHSNKSMACGMYDFLLSLIPKEKIQFLESITNKDGFTPMKLAAHEGDMMMFKYFIKRRKMIYWEFGPVISSLYDLTEIDSWGDELSVIDIICTTKNKAARELINITPLKEILYNKWTKYGFKYFMVWTMLCVIYTIIFTICCFSRPLKKGLNSENVTVLVAQPLNEAYNDVTDFTRLVGELITILGAFLILFAEIPQLFYLGPRKYFGNTVTGGPFQVIMITYALLILLTVLLRLLGDNSETTTMSLALMFAWCNVIYFARGFKSLGYLCIMIQKMIFGDLMRFCYILIIVIIGFGAGFDVHFQELSPVALPYFKDYPNIIFMAFQLMMGLTDLPGPPSVHVPDFVLTLYMIYMMLAFVLLMNLLIALMGDTHYRVGAERKTLWKTQIAATTILLERRLPSWLWPRAGLPGEVLGLQEGRWYFRVEEKNDTFYRRNKKAKEGFSHGSNQKSTNCGWNVINNNTVKLLNNKRERSTDIQ